jgi:hypothetical protein
MKQARIPGRRTLVALTAAMVAATLSGVVGVASPAYAAPANDSIANARAITSVPTRIVQNTGTATSSPNDGECVGGNSVWYRYRPATTRTLRMDTFGSGFDTMLAVFRGPRANRQLAGCSDDAIDLTSVAQVRFVANARYWIAVSTCCGVDSTTGGRSVLSVYRPRVARVTVTLGAVETGAVSGRLYASGTIRCNTRSRAFVSLFVSQRVGSNVARGGNSTEVALCDRTSRAWRFVIDSDTAWAFQEAAATAILFAEGYDGVDFVSTEQTTNVTVGSNPNRTSR